MLVFQHARQTIWYRYIQSIQSIIFLGIANHQALLLPNNQGLKVWAGYMVYPGFTSLQTKSFQSWNAVRRPSGCSSGSAVASSGVGGKTYTMHLWSRKQRVSGTTGWMYLVGLGYGWTSGSVAAVWKWCKLCRIQVLTLFTTLFFTFLSWLWRFVWVIVFGIWGGWLPPKSQKQYPAGCLWVGLRHANVISKTCSATWSISVEFAEMASWVRLSPFHVCVRNVLG